MGKCGRESQSEVRMSCVWGLLRIIYTSGIPVHYPRADVFPSRFFFPSSGTVGPCPLLGVDLRSSSSSVFVVRGERLVACIIMLSRHSLQEPDLLETVRSSQLHAYKLARVGDEPANPRSDKRTDRIAGCNRLDVWRLTSSPSMHMFVWSLVSIPVSQLAPG
jgi:hypothetical protein